jgi:hypothetical protein
VRTIEGQLVQLRADCSRMMLGITQKKKHFHLAPESMPVLGKRVLKRTFGSKSKEVLKPRIKVLNVETPNLYYILLSLLILY